MDAPKCKICQERHYGICLSRKSLTVAKKAIAPDHPKARTVVLNQEKARAECIGMKEATIPAAEAGPAFNKLAYQKEYMRKARAQGKYKRK